MKTVKEQIEKITKELDNFNYSKDKMFTKILTVFKEYENSERKRKSLKGKLEYLKKTINKNYIFLGGGYYFSPY